MYITNQFHYINVNLKSEDFWVDENTQLDFLIAKKRIQLLTNSINANHTWRHGQRILTQLFQVLQMIMFNRVKFYFFDVSHGDV